MNAFFDRYRNRKIFNTEFRAARSWQYGIPAPHRRDWIIRPEDLLVLDFDLHNLRVEPGDDGEKAKLVRSGAGNAYLIVTFPPQNLAERAYFQQDEDYPVAVPPRTDKDRREGEPDPVDPDTREEGEEPIIDDPQLPPVGALLSGWSRLVFRVSDKDLRQPIYWTLEGLLEAMSLLELNVPENALPPELPPMILNPAEMNSLVDSGLIDGDDLRQFDPDAIDLLDPSPAVPASKATQIIKVARARRRVRRMAIRAAGDSGAATGNIAEIIDGARFFGGVLPLFTRPHPQEPSTYQTALELPYRLITSPNRFGAWFHAPEPARSPVTGHTELWHTRLGVRREGLPLGGEHLLRTIRAVWTNDYISTGYLPPNPPPEHINEPFRISLDQFDRHNIVHLSSNFGIYQGEDDALFYEPQAVDVDFLSLTALGAWLDARGVWDFPQPRGLSVEEWRHRAALGRDHYVRVVYAGFLYPWGHRASLIKVTERQFHDDAEDRPAYLRQRMFLVVREPAKSYRNTSWQTPADEQYDLMMPFTEVRITTRVSPLLDRPKSDDVDNKGQSCFWPQVDGEDFLFDLIATDTAENEVEFAMPLIFVGKEHTDQDHYPSIVPDVVKKVYEEDPKQRALVKLSGQRMAFADSRAPDDTVLAVDSLTFGAESPLEVDYNCKKLFDWQKPRFFPVVRSANVNVPALQGIARTAEPAAMVFAGPYLRSGFGGGNRGEVFLQFDPGAAKMLDVSFASQGDRSGALLTPDITLTGLSRLTGPIAGDPDIFAAGDYNADQWFGDSFQPPGGLGDVLSSAKLFGIFSLTEILAGAGINELEKLPRFIGKALNQFEQLAADLGRLDEMLLGLAGAEAAAVQATLDSLLDPATGSIPAIFKGGSPGDVTGQLALLPPQLVELQNSLDQAADLTAGPKALIDQTISTLQSEIGEMLALGDAALDLLQGVIKGDLLPESLDLRYEWRPAIKEISGLFYPTDPLVIAVHASGDNLSILCSLDRFKLTLVDIVTLSFEHIQFRIDGGGKPEIDVRLADGKDNLGDAITFDGPLSFVQTLRNLIPFDGFSDPPDVSVTAEGIEAGFSMGLPNVAVGVFSLENLALAAGFSLPFIGRSVSTWFQFCSRDNPSRLTVSLFGGGFFFGFTVNPKELVLLEGAIEFGANISVNFGIASGSVSAMAGLYFKIEGEQITLCGYFRLRGEVSALGLVTISIEVYLELRYESGKCVGTATISVEVDITFFSISIEITVTKKFAGSGTNADPTFAQMMDVTPEITSEAWTTYCQAFA